MTSGATPHPQARLRIAQQAAARARRLTNRRICPRVSWAFGRTVGVRGVAHAGSRTGHVSHLAKLRTVRDRTNRRERASSGLSPRRQRRRATRGGGGSKDRRGDRGSRTLEIGRQQEYGRAALGGGTGAKQACGQWSIRRWESGVRALVRDALVAPICRARTMGTTWTGHHAPPRLRQVSANVSQSGPETSIEWAPVLASRSAFGVLRGSPSTGREVLRQVICAGQRLSGCSAEEAVVAELCVPGAAFLVALRRSRAVRSRSHAYGQASPGIRGA